MTLLETTQLLGNIGEFVGALAVVATLFYLAVQVRSGREATEANTRAMRAANRQQLVNRAHLATMTFGSQPGISNVIARARSGETLTDDELTQFGYVMRSVLYDAQEAYLLHEEGQLETAYWETRKGLAISYLASETGRKLYERDKVLGVYHAGFVELLDKLD